VETRVVEGADVWRRVLWRGVVRGVLGCRVVQREMVICVGMGVGGGGAAVVLHGESQQHLSDVSLISA